MRNTRPSEYYNFLHNDIESILELMPIELYEGKNTTKTRTVLHFPGWKLEISHELKACIVYRSDIVVGFCNLNAREYHQLLSIE